MTATGGPRRIVSFLPAATEMIYALGLQDQLVGVTQECDYPPEVLAKPIVVRCAIDLEGKTPNEIDGIVRERLRTGEPLYAVDEPLLRSLSPDLIVAQDLCEVCAPSGNEVTHVLKTLPSPPDILYMTPTSLNEVFDNLRQLGRRFEREAQAETFIASARKRLAEIHRRASASPRRPCVFCMEWSAPLYCSGHWVPEMVELAGGVDALARPRDDSRRVSWDEVRRWAPEVLLVSPCGCHLPGALAHVPQLERLSGWDDIPAVRGERVYAVDASSYFARPGPRVVDGVELLAHLIHPELFHWAGARDAYAKIRSPTPGPRGAPTGSVLPEVR